MKDNQLYEKAEQLRKLHTQLCVGQHSLARLTYAQKKGDKFTIGYIVQSGELDDLVDLIDDIKADILKISNDICPDM
ncbi:hypothetical protein IV313_13425 [Enterococcus asini]|nr:hypothetical protein [Enterococcus asini]